MHSPGVRTRFWATQCLFEQIVGVVWPLHFCPVFYGLGQMVVVAINGNAERFPAQRPVPQRKESHSFRTVAVLLDTCSQGLLLPKVTEAPSPWDRSSGFMGHVQPMEAATPALLHPTAGFGFPIFLLTLPFCQIKASSLPAINIHANF